MFQRLDLFKIPSKLKKRIAKNQTNKKIPKSFHVFNLPPPPQNLTQLGRGGGRAVHTGNLCINQRCFRVSGKQHLYTHSTVLTYPIKLYYYTLHLTWSLHTSKLFLPDSVILSDKGTHLWASCL